MSRIPKYTLIDLVLAFTSGGFVAMAIMWLYVKGLAHGAGL